MRPQLQRIDADVLCLQEVHGQERAEGSRGLYALDELLEDTPLRRFQTLQHAPSERPR